jgi:hypothetical protein
MRLAPAAQQHMLYRDEMGGSLKTLGAPVSAVVRG